MAGFHIRMKAKKQQSLSEIEQQIRNRTDADFLSDTRYEFADGHVRLLVFEKYFMRAHGCTGLTVLLTEQGDHQTAELIASGGGEGLSWSGGANRSFVMEFADILTACGFQSTNTEPEKGVIGKVLAYFTD